MSPFMSTVTPVGLCSCPGDRPLTPKRILNWPSLENTWNRFHQRAPFEWNVSWTTAVLFYSMWTYMVAPSHLYALVVAVGHHHSAVTRRWDSLQVCELPFFSAPGTLQINSNTHSKCAVWCFNLSLTVQYLSSKAHTGAFGQKTSLLTVHLTTHLDLKKENNIVTIIKNIH